MDFFPFMPTDIFGTDIPKREISTALDYAAIVMPTITIPALFLCFTAIQFGFVPQTKFRLKISITLFFIPIWLLILNYHWFFGTVRITIWFSHYFAGVSFLTNVIAHLELLKSFIDFGGYITKQHLRNAMIATIASNILFSQIPLFVMLYYINQIPPDMFAQVFNALELVNLGLVCTMEVAGLAYFLYAIRKFIKSKRIKREIQIGVSEEALIIGYAIFAILCLITGTLLHVFMTTRTYEGYRWLQISSSIGCSSALAMPLIFRQISRLNKVVSKPSLVEPKAPPNSIEVIQVPDPIAMEDSVAPSMQRGKLFDFSRGTDSLRGIPASFRNSSFLHGSLTMPRLWNSSGGSILGNSNNSTLGKNETVFQHL